MCCLSSLLALPCPQVTKATVENGYWEGQTSTLNPTELSSQFSRRNQKKERIQKEKRIQKRKSLKARGVAAWAGPSMSHIYPAE